MSKAVSCRRSLEKQADTLKGITEQAGRDCKAYELARDYLLELPGVTDKVLQRYLRPPRSDTPSTMAEVFLRLLLSLRNKNMRADDRHDDVEEESRVSNQEPAESSN